MKSLLHNTNTRQDVAIGKQNGLSLVELMVSLTIASVLSVAVVSSFSSQNGVYLRQAQRVQVQDDGRQAFDILTRLLLHAQAASIQVTDNNSDVLVRFQIPAGFPIWPNLGSGYANNVVFIKWADNTDSTAGHVAHQLRIANSSTISTPAESSFVALVGSDSGNNTRITDFSVVRQADNRNYRVTLSASSGANQNPVQTTLDGLVLPRN